MHINMVVIVINLKKKNPVDTSPNEINPQIPAEVSDNQYGFEPISTRWGGFPSCKHVEVKGQSALQ